MEDHGAANTKAIAIARQMGVTPPTGPNSSQKSDYDKMAKLTGRDFDREFAKHMVADHKNDISAYEKAAATNDPVAGYAKETLPRLQEHLQMAEKLQQQLAAR